MPNARLITKDTRADEENCAQLTLEQLAPFRGQWVALTADGSRIVAAAPDLLELDRRVIAAGIDPEEVCFESVVFDGADIPCPDIPCPDIPCPDIPCPDIPSPEFPA